MSEEVPDSATLEEMALHVISTIIGQKLADISHTKVIVVQFYRKDRGNDRELIPYDTTVGEWRRLANANKAWVEISDGGGGTPVKQPGPELVS